MASAFVRETLNEGETSAPFRVPSNGRFGVIVRGPVGTASASILRLQSSIDNSTWVNMGALSSGTAEVLDATAFAGNDAEEVLRSSSMPGSLIRVLADGGDGSTTAVIVERPSLRGGYAVDNDNNP